MRISAKLASGHELRTGSRMRYASFRLTRYASVATMHGNSAEDVVRHACTNHNMYGFTQVVLDTVEGSIIAAYPALDRDGGIVRFER